MPTGSGSGVAPAGVLLCSERRARGRGRRRRKVRGLFEADLVVGAASAEGGAVEDHEAEVEVGTEPESSHWQIGSGGRT
jgi:hypothetical protein